MKSKSLFKFLLIFIFVLWSSCPKIWANDDFQFRTVTHSNFTCDIGLRIFEPPIKIQGSKIINSVSSPEWFSTWHLMHGTNELTYEEFLALVTPEFIRINNYGKERFENVLKARRNIKLNKRSSYKTTIFYEVRLKKDKKEVSVIASTLHLVDSLDEVPDSIGLNIYLKEKGKWLVHDFMAEKDWLLRFPLSNLEKMKLITSKDQELKLDVNGKLEAADSL